VFWYLIASARFSEKVTNSKIYKTISKYSFEIYLFHDPLNYVLLALFKKLNLFQVFNNGSSGALLFIGLRFFITLFISIIIASLIKKIKEKIMIAKKSVV
jgi:peptidoglycan/LPS O-acetylase OafA/YrhL